jgi:transketolase
VPRVPSIPFGNAACQGQVLDPGFDTFHFGGTYPNLVVLDADVSSSTQTCKFAEAYPYRFFNMGVAEAGMAGTAAGLAACGYHPVISAFAIFLALKSTDQIRNAICYNNLPVVIVGGYAGLSDSFDGASRQSLTDIAVMRSFPHMTVLDAADADIEWNLSEAGKRSDWRQISGGMLLW